MYEALFEQGVDRRGTSCDKWDTRETTFHNPQATPLSVADMDFHVPQEVVDAIAARAAHGVFGYTVEMPGEKQAVVDWMRARHGLSIQPEWILSSPGVVNSIRVAIGALTQPGDSVIIQPPVYGPFAASVADCGCRVRKNCLRRTESGWEMDFNDLEKAFQEGARVLLLCSPHNPVGRVWRRDELERVVRLAKKYGAQLICDEIHSDLILPGYEHTCLLSLDPDAIVFVSSTKTFNLAALSQSSVLIANPALRERFAARAHRTGADATNLFGRIAQTAAYQKGAQWLDELLVYLDGSRAFVSDFLAKNLPMIQFTRPEGTYLMWLDLRALGMKHDEMLAFCHQNGLGVTSGRAFGEEGDGFVRVNLATPRKNLEEAFTRFAAAVRAR